MKIFEQDFLTTEEIAEALKVNQATVVKWVNSGKLKAFQCDRVIRVLQSDFRAFVGYEKG